MGCCNEDNFDPGVLGGEQIFQYVADGTEGATISIVLPFVRPDTSYNVQMTIAKPAVNAFKLAAIDSATITVTGFDVVLSAPAELDDTFMFTVTDRNS